VNVVSTVTASASAARAAGLQKANARDAPKMKTDFLNGFAGQTDISFSEFKGINLRLRFTGKKACAKATAARTIRRLSLI
jgi:hypothetical protein